MILALSVGVFRMAMCGEKLKNTGLLMILPILDLIYQGAWAIMHMFGILCQDFMVLGPED